MYKRFAFKNQGKKRDEMFKKWQRETFLKGISWIIGVGWVGAGREGWLTNFDWIERKQLISWDKWDLIIFTRMEIISRDCCFKGEGEHNLWQWLIIFISIVINSTFVSNCPKNNTCCRYLINFYFLNTNDYAPSM